MRHPWCKRTVAIEFIGQADCYIHGRDIGVTHLRLDAISLETIEGIVIAASTNEVGELIDSLSSKGDRLWPRGEWPSMRLNGPLGVGSSGGQGPVRYEVIAHEPGKSVAFRFTSPTGFHGTFMRGLLLMR